MSPPRAGHIRSREHLIDKHTLSTGWVIKKKIKSFLQQAWQPTTLKQNPQNMRCILLKHQLLFNLHDLSYCILSLTRYYGVFVFKKENTKTQNAIRVSSPSKNMVVLQLCRNVLPAMNKWIIANYHRHLKVQKCLVITVSLLAELATHPQHSRDGTTTCIIKS